jgi:alkylhydroperoxidase family enzyme
MPRLRQVPRADVHPFGEIIYGMLFGDRDPVAEPGTETGSPGDWWTTFALVPDAFDHACASFQFYRSEKRLLDPKLRELGQIRAGWACGSRFVFSQHCKAARDCGFTDEQVDAIPAWQVATCFSPVERAVLAYTDAMAYDHGRVPDDVFALLQEHLSDEEILELTYITGLYIMWAITTRAMRLEFDDVDEHVVEVADPSGKKAGFDVMAMTDVDEPRPPA